MNLSEELQRLVEFANHTYDRAIAARTSYRFDYYKKFAEQAYQDALSRAATENALVQHLLHFSERELIIKAGKLRIFGR
jgi:hypothetical protein